MRQQSFDGYSAEVEIYLVIDRQRYDVAQIGSGSLILRDSHDIPPNTHAQLVMRVDGVEEVEQVFLGDGVQGEAVASFF